MYQKNTFALLLFSCLLAPAAGIAEEHAAVLEWSQKFVVGFPLDGTVSEVHVYPGQSVAGGAKLVELDPEPIRLMISQFKAEVAVREPALVDARREYEHAGSLYEQTLLSDVDLQRKQLVFETATADLAAARARLALAQWKLNKATARAPWPARVIERNVEAGQVLVDESRARPLLVLARKGVMGARARVPQSVSDRLDIGMPVAVLVGNTRYEGRVQAIDIEGQTGLYPVHVEFETGIDSPLIAGEAAKLQLP